MASLFQHSVSKVWHVVTFLGRVDGQTRTVTKTFRDRAAAEQYMTDNGLTHRPRASVGSLADRIRRMSKPDENGCWIWQGRLGNRGYGQMTIAGRRNKARTAGAHRMAYEAFVGPIPEGLQIDHLCFVRSCVNPDHLEAVTSAVNNQRRSARERVSA